MKKNKILRSMIVMILVLISVLGVTTAAAEYVADDGMSFEIVTTKQSYEANEEVQIVLLAKNYNTRMKRANISWNATVPGGELTFLSGDLTGTQKVEVGERAAINLRLMKIVEEPDAPVVQEPETTPTEPVQTDEPEEKKDNSSVVVLIILIVVALAAIGVVVYLIIKRRGAISCIAILLTLGMLLPCIPVMDVSAATTNIGDMLMGEDGELNATVKFTVDGTEYEATATITYEMEAQEETVVEAMHSSMSDLEWEEYSVPEVLPSVGQHPRLRFTEKDIPDIIANLKSEECADMATEFYTYLGTSFNGTFPTLSEQEKAEGRSNYNSKSLLSIRVKALYYALFKNSDDPEEASMAQYYGKTAVRAIQRAMDTIVFSSGYDIYTRGDFQHAAAEVYDWCYDLLTYEDKQNIAAKVQKIGAASEGGWPIHIGTAVTSHLAGSLIQDYWMAVAIAMYDEYPTFYEYIGGAYFDVYLAPRNAWYVSGTHHQGSSYGVGGRGDCDMAAQELIYQMTGGANDYDGDGENDGIYTLDPVAGTSGYQVLYSMRPDGQLFREGDVWEENQTYKYTIWDASAEAMERLSNLYKNGYYRRLAHETSAGLSFTNSYMLKILITHDPNVESLSYYNLPYTRYFGVPSGSMIARTGWDMGTDSNDVLVKMQLTPAYLSNHQHQDAGAFQIYYKGILASESGYYVLYGTQHDLYYHKTSIAHNTLSITSIRNRYGKQINAAVSDWGHEGKQELVNTVVGQEYGPNINKPEYSYLAGDIAGAYQSENDSNVQEAVRSMLFLNLDLEGNTENPGVFIVFDQIKTGEVGSKKSFLLHTQSEPQINGNVVTVTNVEDDYNGKLTNQVLYVGTSSQADADYTINAIGGPGKEFMVGNYNYAHTNSITSDLCQEQGWGRVEISTTTETTDQTDYMLNVMYVSDADGSTQVVPAKLIYDGKGVLMGAQLMNHVAMFNMDGNNRISKTTSFTIPKNEGCETFKVNVAGLKAGTWTVYVNGTAVDTQVASEDGGMIYFEAAAGTVKLVYSSSDSSKTFDETPNTDVEPIGMMINDYYYYTDAHPVKSGEDYLVPVSVVFEALNGKGKWNREGTEYTVEFMGKIYVLSQSSITVGGEPVAFNEMRLENGDLLLDMTTLKQLVAGEGDIYYDKYIDDIRVDVAVETAVPTLSENQISQFPNAVQVEAVIDNGYSTLPMANALDDDPTTRWCSQESGAKITEGIFDLGKVVPLTEVMIKFWTEESLYSDYVFDIYASENGVEYMLIQENARSGEVAYSTATETWHTYMLNCDARYIKIVGHGRFRYNVSGQPTNLPNNTWTSISEVVFLQKAVIDPDGAEMVGNRLQAEAECFHSSNATVQNNNHALSKAEVLLNKGSSSNPGNVSSATAQLYAYFIPKASVPHYVWVRVNTNNVTSGDTLWVNVEGLTGNKYYGENVNLGRTDSNGYRWIKLGQYESTTAMTNLEAGEKYKISVISGCKGLIVDCFMISTDPAYTPYDDCYSQQTNTKGEISVNAKDAIYEYSAATPSGTGAKLQNVSADGSVSQAYKNFVLNSMNLPGDITLDIKTDTSGLFTVYATVKADSASADQFFYTVSVNNSDYKYTLMDMSEDVEGFAAGQFVTVKLATLEAQASDSIYVRFKVCSQGVTVGKISTTCVLPTGVYETTDGKLTVQAENATLSKPGEENVIISNGAYYDGETAQIVDSTGAEGGKAVKLVKTYSAWNQMITFTNEPNSHISFRVMPDEPGEYYIWIKVYAPKDSAIYAYIEGSDDTFYWRQPLTNETYSVDGEDYIWVRLCEEWRSLTQMKAEHHYTWTARRIYTINLRSNTGGVKVDEIFISNDINDAPHNHLFSDSWTADATHHWNAAICGCTDVEPRYYAAHYYEDHTDKECNTCGYANPDYAPHSYENGCCTICGSKEPVKTTNGKLTLEAEDQMLAQDGTENFISGHTGSVIKVNTNAAAEGGKVVQMTKTHSAYNQYLTAGTTPIPHLSFSVTPDKSGQYYIWLKVQTPKNVSYLTDAVYCYIDGGSDSYYWRLPLIKESGAHSDDSADFYWVCIREEWRSDKALTAEHTYNWTAGKTYQLRFRGYASGVQIDQIYITNSASDKPHNHTFHETWEKDDTYHWHNASCEHTDRISGKGEHVYDNVLDTTCNTCGYERPAHEHTYSTELVSDAANHWYECACGSKKDQTAHSYVNNVCSVCGSMKPAETTNGKLTLEAEDLMLAPDGTENFISGYTGSVIKVDTNAAAEGGKVVQMTKTHSAYNQYLTAGTTPIPHLSFSVTPDKSGQYYIWLKVQTPKNVSYLTDAVYCYIDGGSDSYYWRLPLIKADGTHSDDSADFYWICIREEWRSDKAMTAEHTYNWTTGQTYQLRFRGYASGVQIDQIYITTDANDPYVKNHEHTFSEEWTSDDTHHWHAATCEHTGKVMDKAEHTYTDETDATCNVCGAVRELHYHQYGPEWSKDNDSHWQECSCGAQQGKEAHSFVDRICTVCGLRDTFRLTNGYALIEAEDGLLQEAGKENYLTGGTWATVPPFEIIDHPFGAGKTLVAKQGSTAWYGLQTYSKNHNGEDPSAHASYTVQASESGEHYIWLKVYTPNSWTSGSGDAVYAFIGDDKGTDTYFWRQPLKDTDGTYSDDTSDFYWVRVYQQFNGTSQTGKNKVYTWTAGETYDLRFRVYSPNVQIDQILVTTSNQTPEEILGN